MEQIDSAARAAMLVPQSTRDNYIEQVRRAAVARGISLEEARTQQVKNWRAQHEADAMGGWNVLADWLEGTALDAGPAVDPAAAAKVRALESAKRDPGNPQAAVLDMSDTEVRDEVDQARRDTAARTSGLAPVTKDDGTEVPAAAVADELAKSKPAKPAAGKAGGNR
ncbi:hypothetical protein [Micromonospora aurantiaca (nom. illeg.)]|uniref:hypothetical protein n=1 Tax=Micromonospora aurantiaca (nom. illeg.) TaxID=47850 RepID=UPI0033F4A63F